jgi:hypothetical protein
LCGTSLASALESSSEESRRRDVCRRGGSLGFLGISLFVFKMVLSLASSISLESSSEESRFREACRSISRRGSLGGAVVSFAASFAFKGSVMLLFRVVRLLLGLKRP